MDWAQILVYVLAILFAIFLVFAIFLAVLLLKVTKEIKTTTESAGRAVHAIENSVTTLQKTALPLMVTKTVIGQLMKQTRRSDKKMKDE